MKTKDTEVLGRQRAKPSKIKARYSRPTIRTAHIFLSYFISYFYAVDRNFEWEYVFIASTFIAHAQNGHLDRYVPGFASPLRPFLQRSTDSFQSQHVLPRHPASVVLRISSSSERCFIAHGIIAEFTEAHNLALTNHAHSGRRPNLSATCRAVCHNVSSLKPEGDI